MREADSRTALEWADYNVPGNYSINIMAVIFLHDVDTRVTQ